MSRDSIARAYASITPPISAVAFVELGAGGGAALTCGMPDGAGLVDVAAAGGGTVRDAACAAPFGCVPLVETLTVDCGVPADTTF